jgi:hypothetical protein
MFFLIAIQGMVFGHRIITFDAYCNGGGTALSFQPGVGLRF